MNPRMGIVLLGMAFTAPAGAADPAPWQDAPTEWARRASLPEAVRCTADAVVSLPVALLGEALGPEFSYDAASGHLHFFYPTGFNQVTEGWNWHPLEAAAGGDYYEFKYLPLGSTLEERSGYEAVGTDGVARHVRVQWRHDYYFAFDNPDAFYPRGSNDDAGIAADFAVAPQDAKRLRAGALRLILRGRLGTNCVADSTTYFRATPDRPVDLTVKKHYLIGKLSALRYYDAVSGQPLAPLSAAQQNADGETRQAP